MPSKACSAPFAATTVPPASQAQAGKAINCKASVMKSGLVDTRFMDTMGRLKTK